MQAQSLLLKVSGVKHVRNNEKGKLKDQKIDKNKNTKVHNPNPNPNPIATNDKILFKVK